MNTAKRLLGILDVALKQPAEPNIRSATVWARAFGLDTRDDDEVTLAMQAFRSEVGLLVQMLTAAGIPSELYLSQLDRIRNAAAPAQMQVRVSATVPSLGLSSHAASAMDSAVASFVPP